MKNIIFFIALALICAIGFFAFISKSHFGHSLTINEFLNIQKIPPDVLPEHSDPVVFDKLLFDGKFMQALLLLGEDTILQNDNSIESKRVKRESMVITKDLTNQKLQAIVVFYSFSLESPQIEIPSRQWMGILWERNDLKWFPTQKLSTIKEL